MRKIILLVAIVFSVNANAQESQKTDSESQKVDFKKNELKLNALYLVLGAFDVTYERAINDESSFGTSLTFIIDNNADVNTVFAFSPYYRFYFGKKPVSGFYMEGFSLYESLKRDNTYYDSNNNVYIPVTEKVNALALGIGLGGKWYTKRNVMFEIGMGIGRNISVTTNYDNINYSRITGKIAISVGYRF